MLSAENRLTKKKDFERVLKQGKGLKQDSLLFKTDKNELKAIRFGFIVSKKVSKKAVIRNLVKRRLRGIVRGRLSIMRKGIDGVLIALPGIEEKDYGEIEEGVDKLFEKAEIYE